MNNPLKYTDPNGYWWGWDDAIVSAVGFAVGYVSYGITKGDWGWKAVGTGLACAAVAELGYLTLGGGLADPIIKTATSASNFTFSTAATTTVTSSTIPMAGSLGAFSSAVSYSASFAAYSAINVAQHYDQIKDASDFGAGMLITGYAASAALSAGFQSRNMGGKIDRLLGIGEKSIFGGAVSYGIGGALSNGGNEVLSSYDSKYDTWNINGGRVLKQMGIGFVTSSASKLVGNYFDKIGGNYFGRNGNFLRSRSVLGYSSLMAAKSISMTATSVGVNNLFSPHNDYPWNLNNAEYAASQWFIDMVKLLNTSK